jgi:hypothetical protein
MSMTKPENAKKTSRAALNLGVALLAVAFLTGCPWKKEIEKLKTDNASLSGDKQKLEGQLASAGVETAEMQTTIDEVQKGLEELACEEVSAAHPPSPRGTERAPSAAAEGGSRRSGLDQGEPGQLPASRGRRPRRSRGL